MNCQSRNVCASQLQHTVAYIFISLSGLQSTPVRVLSPSAKAHWNIEEWRCKLLSLLCVKTCPDQSYSYGWLKMYLLPNCIQVSGPNTSNECIYHGPYHDWLEVNGKAKFGLLHVATVSTRDHMDYTKTPISFNLA